MRALAISLLGYTVSGSTVAAGWLGTSSMIAQQVASVFGGTFVDRHDRKRLIVMNAVVGVLAWGTIPVLLLRGVESDLVLKDTAEEMTRRGPGARGLLQWVEVPGCGHAPALNVPEQLALVSDFIERAHAAHAQAA